MNDSVNRSRNESGAIPGGIRKGRERTKNLIHASRPTSRESAPVDNATAAPTPDRLGWMALRAIGGGRR